jgi:hypothetical protein
MIFKNIKNGISKHKKTIIAIVIIVIIAIIIVVTLTKEKFINVPLGSKSGFGFQEQDPNMPLFINFYPKQLGSDFALNGLLRHLKVNKLNPTIVNGNELQMLTESRVYGYGQNGSNQVNIGAPKVPIIIIPTIGASKVYAKWSRNGSDYVKTLDSYKNFETSEKWKCKDIQNEWTSLWFPEKGVDGLVEFCWSSIAKTEPGPNGPLAGPVNANGVKTTVNDMGQLDFEPGYDTLIKALNAIGYVNGSTLFGANYDFRKITTDMPTFTTQLKALIETVDHMGTGVVIIGHGFGASLANAFINSVPAEWKSKHVNSFVSVSGAFGGCPKALRVLLSGESGPNASENLLIRNTVENYDSLRLMLPNPAVYGPASPGTLIETSNYVSYTINDIPKILKESGIIDINTGSMSASILKDPQVPVYVLRGTNVFTESNYMYPNLTEGPQPSPEVQKNYSGDGTMPDIALDYPMSWSNVKTKVYDNAEHVKILSMLEPIQDILTLVNDINYGPQR